MTKCFLSIVAALWLFRIADHSGVAAAALYTLGVVVLFLLGDGAALLARKARGAAPTKGGRA